MSGAVQSGTGELGTELSKYSLPIGREDHDLGNPATNSQSLVDSALRLPLDFLAGFGQQAAENTRPEFGRLT
jgi:hypothetical protein